MKEYFIIDTREGSRDCVTELHDRLENSWMLENSSNGIFVLSRLLIDKPLKELSDGINNNIPIENLLKSENLDKVPDFFDETTLGFLARGIYKSILQASDARKEQGIEGLLVGDIKDIFILLLALNKSA